MLRRPSSPKNTLASSVIKSNLAQAYHPPPYHPSRQGGSFPPPLPPRLPPPPPPYHPLLPPLLPPYYPPYYPCLFCVMFTQRIDRSPSIACWLCSKVLRRCLLSPLVLGLSGVGGVGPLPVKGLVWHERGAGCRGRRIRRTGGSFGAMATAEEVEPCVSGPAMSYPCQCHLMVGGSSCSFVESCPHPTLSESDLELPADRRSQSVVQGHPTWQRGPYAHPTRP